MHHDTVCVVCNTHCLLLTLLHVVVCVVFDPITQVHSYSTSPRLFPCVNLVHLALPLSPSLSHSTQHLLSVVTQGMLTPPPLLLLSLSLLLSPALSAGYRASGCDGSSDRPNLYIQGFVPASGAVFTSETIVPAASVACRQVNTNSSVLGDYELVIEWSNTEVQYLAIQSRVCYSLLLL